LDTLLELASTDEKRGWKEIPETYLKILDFGIIQVGKLFEGSKSRDSIQAPKFPTLEMSDYGAESSTVTFLPTDYDIDWLQYLGTVCIPSLVFKIDQDRLCNIIHSISTKIITPAISSKQKVSIMKAILGILNALVPISAGIKYWKKQVWTYITDINFFTNNKDTLSLWIPIVHTIVSLDQDLFLEQSKVYHSSTTGIFITKEQETIIKIQSLKILSFCIYTAPKDFYVSKLPIVQEKLVDLLKSNSKAVTRCCIDCISIIYAKISCKYLSHFWPILFYELVSLINQTMAFTESKLPFQPLDFQILLSASKLLYTLSILDIDEFQWHQEYFFGLLDLFMQSTPVSVSRPVELETINQITTNEELVSVLAYVKQSFGLKRKVDLDKIMLSLFKE
jgi:hypothetical protein